MQFLELIGQINKGGKQSISAQQIEAARNIYNQSIANNIDPRLTLSMAWQESSLGGRSGSIGKGDLSRGKDYALGTMQVLRSTAKGMGMEAEWLEAEKGVNSGKRRFDLEAAMGVNYTKRLIENHGAKNVADVAAGYNGGPPMIGTNYGKVQGHVQKVMSHMGKFFGDGQKVDWKSPVTPNGMAYAPAGATNYQSGAGAAPTAPTAPQMPNLGDLQIAAEGLAPTDSPDAGMMIGGQKDVASFNQQLESMFRSNPVAQTEVIGQDAEYLAPLKYMGEDPKTAMSKMLTQEYNDMYDIQES